ncbi:MAG: RHS repeat-associated core domain-containing protein [Candidatus Competibacteraceae bacterium]|nr:RHS repeat-associated core domain-containing protein [Candidatus Competibacteraceae bacterium]
MNRFKYSPYGESPSMSGTSHGYTGQRYDSETGLYYCKMRYYSPKIGRFLQADPVGYSAGLNLYAYGGNNPTSGSDPMGLTFGATWGSAVYQAYLQGQGIIPPPGDYVAPPPVAEQPTPAPQISGSAFGSGGPSFKSADLDSSAQFYFGAGYDLLTNENIPLILAPSKNKPKTSGKSDDDDGEKSIIRQILDEAVSEKIRNFLDRACVDYALYYAGVFVAQHLKTALAAHVSPWVYIPALTALGISVFWKYYTSAEISASRRKFRNFRKLVV